MKVKVLFFARLREQLGSSGEEVDIADGASVATLRAQLASRSADWRVEADRILAAAKSQGPK